VQPAGFIFFMGIAAEGFDAFALIAMEGFRELVGDFGVARSAESDEEDAKVQPGSKAVHAIAGQERHGSGAIRRGQWKFKASADFKSG
jgi:hypothetical protein